MRYPRRIRLFAAVLALVSLLFTQVALASYDCPQLAQPLQASVAMHGDVAQHADCCTPHAKQTPNLCEAHGQAKAQSPDTPAQPLVPPFVPARLLVSLASVEVALPSSLDAPLAFLESAGSTPPIPIRHCCLRN